MSTIILRDVSFAHVGASDDVFSHLDLILASHWRSALLGRNGRGKTTLLRLLAGELEPQQGEILHDLTMPLFRPLAVHPATRGRLFDVVREQVGPYVEWQRQLEALLDEGTEAALVEYGELLARYEAADGYRIDARLEAALEQLGFGSADRLRPFASFSGGEQTRALLASLFLRPGSYPLLDEPTEHLDRAGRVLVADFLASCPGFLLVSHDRDFLDRCVDHVLAIENTGISRHDAGFSSWLLERDRRLAFEAQRNRQLQAEIRQLRVAARQRREGAAARERDKAAHTDKGYIGHRAAKQMKRAMVIERRMDRAAEQRQELLGDVERVGTLTCASLPPPAQILLTLTDLALAPLWRHLSLRVAPGDRIAIRGANGSGKTRLLDLLAGREMAGSGVLQRASGLMISRSLQQPSWTRATLQASLQEGQLDSGRLRQTLGAMGLAGDVIDGDLDRLSPGAMKKLDLALNLIRPAHLRLWDEPLNHLDLETREQIEQAVLASRPTLIVVEHDGGFIDRIATRVIDLPPAQA